MAALQERLDRLKNRRTLYELAAVLADRKVLVAYCGRRGRSGLWHACVKRGPELAALCGTDRLTFATRAGDGATMGDWTIRFTGRTQRECYIEGELPFVCDVSPVTSPAKGA
jgi:hypothetical protein